MDSTLFEKYYADVKRVMAENEMIACHAVLEHVFLEAVQTEPKLIVELGTGVKGLRTQVLCRVSDLFNASQISCDIRDCQQCGNSWYHRWHFVRSDDVEFSKRFMDFCLARWIEPKIDLLFIDTDELYPHIKQEIESWFPFLSQKCAVMFRCTNLQKTLLYSDGRTTNLGWDNERGVIRALQEYLNEGWDETKEWFGKIGDWKIKHWPWGAGLTVMRRG